MSLMMIIKFVLGSDAKVIHTARENEREAVKTLS